MTIPRIDRLRTMGRKEMAFRAQVAARTHIQRLSSAISMPAWERSDLTRVLAPHVLDPALLAALNHHDWLAVHRQLENILRARPSRFVIDAQESGPLRDQILSRWPEAAADAATRANRILDGEYDVLGYRQLPFMRDGGAVDWHFDPVSRRSAPRKFWADVPFLDPRVGDHKVIWEINRHQHWLALGRALWLTGDRRYGTGIADQLTGWLDNNPPLVGINWASMLELAFRSLSWLTAMHMLLADLPQSAEAGGSNSQRPWLVDLLIGLDRQLRHIEQNLSHYFSPNTHLTGEALALYVAGQSVPELARAPRWTDIGREILLREIPRQIEADGGHAERSLHYHRYTHDFYLLAVLVAERAGDEEAAGVLREAVGRMAVFMRAVTDDTGHIPQIGDDDGGTLWQITGREPADVRDSLALSAVVLGRPDLTAWGLCEETFWLAWQGYRTRLTAPPPLISMAPEPNASLAVFPNTGYVAVRDGHGGHLVFDAGPHGYLNCGHAHADALSVTLGVARHPLLIDPGTFSYTSNPAMRDRMRRTANHNTLTVDGASSATPAGPFHWRSRADARLNATRGNARFAWAEGSHDGYRGLRHRRSIVQGDGGWLLIDELVGTPGVDPEDRSCEARLHWHFDPRWSVARESEYALLAEHADGTAAWLVHDGGASSLVRGDDESGLGWCSPRYGALLPTWCARVSRPGPTPVAMVTWIGMRTSGQRPSVERVAAEADAGGSALAVRLSRNGTEQLTMLRGGDTPARASRSCRSGDYRTDARLLQYSLRSGALLSLAAVDASQVTALRDGLISIVAERPVADLHLLVVDDWLDLRSSMPLPRMRLEGLSLDAVRTVRLNGRRVQPDRARDGALVISGAVWAQDPNSRANVCVA